MNDVTTPVAGASVPTASLWEDFVDIFSNPSAVFMRRRDGRAGLAIVVYTILGLLTFYVARPTLQPAFDKQISAQIAKIEANPQLSADQKETITRRMRSAVESPLTYIGPAIVLPLTLALTALVLWLVAKGFESRATYAQSLAVTAIAGIPRAVLGLVLAGVSSAMGRTVTSQYALTLSPAALLGDNPSEVVAAALSRLDVGVLWHTILLGIGIAIVGQIPRAKGLAAAGVTWVVGGLVAIAGALRAAAAATP